MLAYKLYIGNKRANSRLAKFIKINKEFVTIEYRKKSTIDNQERLINNIIIWSKQIEMIMKERI